jgi:hypothetical protein
MTIQVFFFDRVCFFHRGWFVFFWSTIFKYLIHLNLYLLLFIQNLNSWFRTCDIVFQWGWFFLQNLPYSFFMVYVMNKILNT